MMVITAPAGDTGHQVLGNVLASDRPVRVIVRPRPWPGTDVAGHAGLVTSSLAVDDLIASTGLAFRALTIPIHGGEQGLARPVPPPVGDRWPVRPGCGTAANRELDATGRLL